ncbi:ABC-F family ATP-binding cassette domain-containing protein [Dyadobacter fanqingshengii]|uniref:ATP-binding cassette domain-containing protein n=1 Tax=Dyadobacter fanqingshengii TaxID=2906443 RepID=A0A9X1PDE8_9BACT|nr:ABC-F family ATP-binding cassette domain-containing protein [Dyadobacter fanqingshengii]MCF0041595.1 ATP-binding cassette domain-containing protein [Dyadobacter fanqingshengii]USJ36688.1 ATP-binding cassette domain-containing protein [Dyadobacter fanqingshengii]
MLFLQEVAYAHPNRDVLLSDINLSVNKQDKIALIGHNGAGKSTLLKILAGEIAPTAGLVKSNSKPYYVPQLFGQFNEKTIAEALGVSAKINALKGILDGDVTEANLTTLNDDWSIDERCQVALSHWNLTGLDLSVKMGMLSGGQKTKVFLAGIMVHNPELVLLDEPSNHLDMLGRDILYDYIQTTPHTLLVVSHDQTLLNLAGTVLELSKRRITAYGGNYDFYLTQKTIENDALNQDLKSKEKALRKAKETERQTMERQQKLDSRGKKKQEKAGLPTILMNTLKNSAEKSTSKIKGVHAEKIESISQDLSQLRSEISDTGKMKLDLDNAALHQGKILVTAENLNVGFKRLLWQKPLNFQIMSGERIAIKGANGSGKTTLIKIILGDLLPGAGNLQRAEFKAIYIDQDYSLIDNSLSIYQQAQRYNTGMLQEHEVKTRLDRFLFPKEYWDKPCVALSGGEKMRLMLCSLTIGNQAPDMIILDEPTNNLDIHNIEILTNAINEYKGTLLVVSHDAYFLQRVRVETEIDLSEFR